MSTKSAFDTPATTPVKSPWGTPTFKPVKNSFSTPAITPFTGFGALAIAPVKNVLGTSAITPVQNPSFPTANWNKIRVSPLQALRLDGPIVEICVGKELRQKIFSVHQALIAPRSEFFERAFNGNWKESESRLINLPEDDATIFDLYVQLLYTGQIPIKDDDCEFDQLCKLYVLCEKLQDIDAKNAILQAMLAEIRGTRTPSLSVLAVNTIYHGTPENSPARNLILDLFVERGNRKSIHRLILEDHYPAEFVRHLAVQLLKQRSFEGSETLSDCHVRKYQEKV